MFKLNRKLEYALLALKYMGRKEEGRLTSAKEIVDCYGIPFDPTSRVLQIMAQHRVLHAEHGAHGGYRIARPLAEIRLEELSAMVVGPIRLTPCLGEAPGTCATSAQCTIFPALSYLNDRISGLFASINLADLLACGEQSGNGRRTEGVGEQRGRGV